MRPLDKLVVRSKWLFWLLAAGLLAGSAGAADRPASDAAAAFHIQAHRGAGIAAPENTLEAFTMSWDMGVTPEADLRTTKDREVVCFHDPDLSRVVSNVEEDQKSKGIEQLDYATVRSLEVGSFRGERFAGQYVPALASVFAAMRGRPERLLYLDVKTVDLDQLVSLIHQFGVERQVIFTSEKYPLIRSWKQKLPESLTLLWNRGTEAQLNTKLQMLRDAGFAGITYFQIHVFVGDLASDDPFTPPSDYLRTVGEELTSRGIVFQVLPWECSDARAYGKLLDLGVASFATDYPPVTIEAVQQFRQAESK